MRSFVCQPSPCQESSWGEGRRASPCFSFRILGKVSLSGQSHQCKRCYSKVTTMSSLSLHKSQKVLPGWMRDGEEQMQVGWDGLRATGGPGKGRGDATTKTAGARRARLGADERYSRDPEGKHACKSQSEAEPTKSTTCHDRAWQAKQGFDQQEFSVADYREGCQPSATPAQATGQGSCSLAEPERT